MPRRRASGGTDYGCPPLCKDEDAVLAVESVIRNGAADPSGVHNTGRGGAHAIRERRGSPVAVRASGKRRRRAFGLAAIGPAGSDSPGAGPSGGSRSPRFAPFQQSALGCAHPLRRARSGRGGRRLMVSRSAMLTRLPALPSVRFRVKPPLPGRLIGCAFRAEERGFPERARGERSA